MDIEIMAPEEENDVEGQNRILKQAILKNPDAHSYFSPPVLQNPTVFFRRQEIRGYGSHLLTLIQKKVFRRSQLPQTMWRQEKNLGEFASFSAETGGSDRHCCPCKRRFYCCGKRKRDSGKALGKFEKNIVDVVYCDSRYDKSYDLTMETDQTRIPVLKMIARDE